MDKSKWLFSITHYTKEIAEVLDNTDASPKIKGFVAEVVITAYENLVKKEVSKREKLCLSHNLKLTT